MTENEPISPPEGSLVAVEGALASSAGGTDGLRTPLPSTRALTPSELAKVDEEEGLDSTLTVRANPDAAKPHSPAEILGALAGLAIVVGGLMLVFPISRFLPTKLAEGTASYASAVTAENKSDLSPLRAPSNQEKVLQRVKELSAERRFTEVVDLCRRTIGELENERAVHRAWERTWAVYFETLWQLKRWTELRRACKTLAQVNPDSDALAYYRAAGWLDEMKNKLDQGPIPEATCQLYLDILASSEQSCRLRTDGQADRVVDGKTELRRLSESDQHFVLLLSDICLMRWRLKGRPMTEAGLQLFARALEPARRVPEGVNRARQELAVWEEYRKGLRLWRSMKAYSQTVGSETITTEWVEKRVAELRRQLTEGRAK